MQKGDLVRMKPETIGGKWQHADWPKNDSIGIIYDVVDRGEPWSPMLHIRWLDGSWGGKLFRAHAGELEKVDGPEI